MSTITVRLFHHPSRTPIAELQGVDPGATLASLRALAERHLAAEEACMMRVFNKWHIEVQLGARKAVVELTAQDEAASLSSLGIEDYSAVLLEGPLTHTVEGVGQGLAILAVQTREHNSRMEGILLRIAEGISGLVAGQSKLVAVTQHIDSRQKYNDRIAVFDAAEAGGLTVAAEEVRARDELLAPAISEYQRILRCFSIDPTTPQPTVALEGSHTAILTASVGNNSWVTLRASQPLSAANHRWAVRIHEEGREMAFGLLPKLSATEEVRMGNGGYMGNLRGWCFYQRGSDSRVYGDWQCEPLPFAEGDLVLFDYSFTDKTLTIRCGDRQVVGHIRKAGEELYPAFSFAYTGTKIGFEKYPQLQSMFNQ